MFGRKRGRSKPEQGGAAAGGQGPVVSVSQFPSMTAAKQAAAGGSAEDMNRLGVQLRMNGQLDEAAQWFVKAADAGSQDATANMAQLLMTQHRNKEAAQWFRRAGGPLGEAMAKRLLEMPDGPDDDDGRKSR